MSRAQTIRPDDGASLAGCYWYFHAQEWKYAQLDVTHHAATLWEKYVITQLGVTCRTLTHNALLNTSALPLRCGLDSARRYLEIICTREQDFIGCGMRTANQYEVISVSWFISNKDVGSELIHQMLVDGWLECMWKHRSNFTSCVIMATDMAKVTRNASLSLFLHDIFPIGSSQLVSDLLHSIACWAALLWLWSAWSL